MSRDLGNECVPDVVIPREQMTFIETRRFEVRKTFGIRRLRARWNFCVQLCRKTALPGNETVVGVNFNTFLTFWADMRRLRCFCLSVTGFEKLCTRYCPRDSVIACRPCVIIVLRGTLDGRPLISATWRVCCLWFRVDCTGSKQTNYTKICFIRKPNNTIRVLIGLCKFWGPWAHRVISNIVVYGIVL